MTLTCFASAETVKHERVYAVTNAAGDALTVIDNVRLENGDALTEIDDRTLLTALENVGGTEKFTQSGETVTWKADGNSIIYQGTSDKALNVTPVVHMTLDGIEITAADVKNASGELVMTVSYRAESPFLAVTLMPLSDDVTSVTVDNGTVLTDGAHSFLMGFGVPGADADLELPDSFTMTAHVDHADLNWMMTIATAQPVKVLTDALSDHAADAHTLVSDLTAGLNALADGSEIPESNEDIHELLTALNTLFDGAAQLKDGSITLLDGVKTLKDGLDTLSSNSTALNDGAAQLFAAVLDTANTQLSAAGLDALSIEVPTLTASNYAAVLDDLSLLQEFGFVCEDFGGGTVLIREVPADILAADAAATLEELAQKLALGRADPEGARDELLHTMACKSAIKAGMTTDATELAALVEKVQSGEILYCPHGRPVKYKLSKYDIEKMFKRA